MADEYDGGPNDRVDVRHLRRVEAELRHALEIVRRQGDRLQDAQREVLALRQRIAQTDQEEQRQARELIRVRHAIQTRDDAATDARFRRAVQRRSHWTGRASRRLDQLNLAIESLRQSEAPAGERWRAAARLIRQPRAIAQIAAALDSGLFDAAYYTRMYRSKGVGAIPLVSYILDGQHENHRPNPMFDPVWYRARYPDVAESGLPPLTHYLLVSERELRDTHPLFDAARYARISMNGAGLPLTPLAHYLLFGADPLLSPHALFDPAFYLRKYPDVAAAGVNPLVHLLEHGTRDRRQGHPLIDPHFYFAQHPRAAATGDDALVCFCARGAALGHSPHPLFDTAFYLETNPEVRAAGTNALEHFLEVGWRDGRRPNPLFDPRYYLARYSDVRASGVNPLVHFVEHGSRQLRDPSAEFSTTDYLARYSDVAHAGADALSHYLYYGRLEGRTTHPAPPAPAANDAGSLNVVTLPDSGLPVRLTAVDRNPPQSAARTIIVATHVVPVPPRAGNSYRLLRLITWLKRSGYRTILVVAPLENGQDANVGAIAGEVGDTILVRRDGTLEHVLEDGRELLAALDARTVHRRPGVDMGDAWQIVDDSYCHDAMVEVVLHLQAALHPCALLVQYIWMSRLLALADRRTLKILDTIDAYSTKTTKVGDFGIGDHFVDEREEAMRLERADLVLAIQPDERAELARVIPHRRVITVGVDFAPVGDSPRPDAPTIGYVGSDNPMNMQGLRDFLRFAWPRILTRVPNAELMVAGDACAALAGAWPNVRRVGTLDDLDAFYSACRVVINPANAGTGLKIKGLEALCHFRPLVSWPAGVEGFGPLAQFALLARDWFEFAEQVCRALTEPDLAAFTDDDRRIIRQMTETPRVYAELAAELDAFFDHRPLQTSAASSGPLQSAR